VSRSISRLLIPDYDCFNCAKIKIILASDECPLEPKLASTIFVTLRYLLLEGETTILVGVEESHESVGLALGGGEVAVILKVGEELVGGNVAVFVTVNALESGVRGEVTDGAETCASGLKGALTVTNSDKQVLQSVLRFVAKHFQIVVVSTQDKSQISKGKTCRVAEFRWPHF